METGQTGHLLKQNWCEFPWNMPNTSSNNWFLQCKCKMSCNKTRLQVVAKTDSVWRKHKHSFQIYQNNPKRAAKVIGIAVQQPLYDISSKAESHKMFDPICKGRVSASIQTCFEIPTQQWKKDGKPKLKTFPTGWLITHKESKEKRV